MKKLLYCLFFLTISFQLLGMELESAYTLEQLKILAQSHSPGLQAGIEKFSVQHPSMHDAFLKAMGYESTLWTWDDGAMDEFPVPIEKQIQAFKGEVESTTIISQITNAIQKYDGKDTKIAETIKSYSWVTKMTDDRGSIISPLEIACENNNDHSIQLLLYCTQKKAANYLYQHKGHSSVLKVTSEATLQLLFECEAISKQKDSLLEGSIANENTALAKVAISSGADVNATTISGKFPLVIRALQSGSLKIAELLIKSNTLDINCCAPDTGNTPLHLAIRNCYTKEGLNLVKIILEKPGVNLAVKNLCGDTPLHTAINKNDASMLQEIVSLLCTSEKNIDINGHDGPGQTPLYRIIDKLCICCSPEKNEIYKKVVDNVLGHPKIDVNAKNRSGYTPLHRASESYDNAQAVELLLDVKGIDVNPINNEKQTPLDLAKEKNRISKKTEVLDLLKRRGAKTNAELNGAKSDETKNNVSRIKEELVEDKDDVVTLSTELRDNSSSTNTIEDTQLTPESSLPQTKLSPTDNQKSYFSMKSTFLGIGFLGFVGLLLLYGYKNNWHFSLS